MTGNCTGAALKEFWDHCSTLEEWKDHPCLSDPSIDRSRTQVANHYKVCCSFVVAPKNKTIANIIW